MSFFISGIVVGLFIGIKFQNHKQDHKIEKLDVSSRQGSLADVESDDPASGEESNKLKKFKMARPSFKKTNIAMKTIKLQPDLHSEEDQAPEKPSHLSFHISEDQIEKMEHNLADLEKDVSLFRGSEGWTVRFHRHSNLMSSLGFHDNDFIRYEQFHQMKTDPEMEKLVGRVESIFNYLTR